MATRLAPIRTFTPLFAIASKIELPVKTRSMLQTFILSLAYSRAIARNQDAQNCVAAVRALHKEASLQRSGVGDGTPSERDLSPGPR